jgi:hypothetical protein
MVLALFVQMHVRTDLSQNVASRSIHVGFRLGESGKVGDEIL